MPFPVRLPIAVPATQKNPPRPELTLKVHTIIRLKNFRKNRSG
ncbi:hypothetical protein CBM2587_B10079 [Cupriavidus taiwanensis]|uniref:Uncharacterized protein n=1 Tax=Cupriavidus taiwanensis TaxID=164546 RepID=A0A375BX61_9BURK|nr:hypothetical protein CBM2587_B10079 [Cupriavidus taiwanensis]